MNTRSVWRPDKDEVVAEHGAVATAHPIAAQVGVDILKSGGNAVDAAIATGFCLNVVEPASSSIAGHGQMVVYMSGEGRTLAIDYGHRAPKAATADMFRVIGQAVTGNGIYEVEDRANAIGHRSVGFPESRPECAAPMSSSAPYRWSNCSNLLSTTREKDFEADLFTRLQIAGEHAEPRSAQRATARVFLPERIPTVARRKGHVQRDLADTIERIGKEGKDALHIGRNRGGNRRGDEAARRSA